MLQIAIQKVRGAFELDAKFELPTPGVVALFGRSGCGKSTLVNIIAGLLSPDRGRVVLDDVVLLDTEKNIDVPAERLVAHGLIVFQDARLFPHLKGAAANLQYAQRRAASAPFVTLDRVADLAGFGPSLMERRSARASPAANASASPSAARC